MTTELSQQFDALNSDIKQGLETFVDVGRKLLHMKESRLFNVHYATWEDYCKNELGRSKRHADRLIKGAKVVALIEDGGESNVRIKNGTRASHQKDPKLTHRASEKLSQSSDDERPHVWERAQEIAGEGEQVTATHVDQAMEETGAYEDDGADVPESPYHIDVPASVETVLNAADKFREVLGELSRVKKKVKDSIESDEAWESCSWNQLEKYFKDIRNHIKHHQPHAPCPYCLCKSDDCRACDERGWLTLGKWKAAPADKRAQVMEE